MSAPHQQRGVDGWREPAGRSQHRTAVVDDRLYLWAGDQDEMPRAHDNAEKRQIYSSVKVFDMNAGCWEQRTTRGTPPLGVTGYSCVAVRNELLYFGGYCGHRSCYHNSVHTLSTSTLQWRMLAPSTTEDGAPMQKNWCGMVHFTDGEEDLLYVVGGLGHAVPSSPQHGAQYQPKYGSGIYTNEQHIFSLSTNDGWSSPVLTGQVSPPCYSFTLTTVEGKRAAMFGGTTPSSDYSDDLYIVDLERHSVNWTKIKKPVSQSVQWPVGRLGHVASHITGPVFVMSGGSSAIVSTLNDVWLYDSNQWIKLPTLPDSVTGRKNHSMSAFHLGAHCVWILVFGGWYYKAGTSIIELIQDTSGQWCVERVMERETLSNNTEYQERLRVARIKGAFQGRELRIRLRISELDIERRQLQQQLQESGKKQDDTHATQPSATPPQSLPAQQPSALAPRQRTPDKPAAYSQAPSIPKLMKLVAMKIPTKWYKIGIQLEIEVSTLEAFEQQTSDQERLYSKVFDLWKREQKVPFTWETIITTLEEADENSTAAGIREWLDTL